MTSLAARPVLHRLAEEVARARALDGPAEAVAGAVRTAIPKGPIKDALSGTWLGHTAHPLFTDLPIGTWTASALLDVLGGRDSRPAAQRLVAIGVLAAAPTAATGLNDWADTTPASDGVRRLGAVHAVANVAALALYGASWTARRHGRHRRGAALGLAGLGALTVGGHLGGHLSYSRAVGVDQTALETGPAEWTVVFDDAALPDGQLRAARVHDRTILLARVDGQVRALADRCAHRGGALHEGRIVDGCVECPLHGSRFRLDDGSVERGPSAYPQPRYEVRVRDGRIAVRAVT
jgi:nitrite reductase/ring-hydroxylating ferredoxin subunit